MQTATPTFDVPQSRHSQRKRIARIYLVVIGAMILLADALLSHFVFSDNNPWEPLIGILFGQAVSAPLLIVAIWRRLNWARFVLIALLFVVVGIFGLVVLYTNSQIEYQDRWQLAVVAVALGILTIANTWLIRSKRIQHLARMGQAGCHDTGAL